MFFFQDVFSWIFEFLTKQGHMGPTTGQYASVIMILTSRPWTTSYKNFVVRFHISRHHFYILGLISDRWSHNWPIIKCHNDHYFMSMDYQLKKFCGEHLHFQAPFLYPRTIQRTASSGFRKVMLKPQSTGNKI